LVGTARGFRCFPCADPGLFRGLPAPKGRKFLKSWSSCESRVKGNTIRLAGAKSVNYPEKASLHRRERLAGRFDRAVTFPVEIDADGVKAECRDGILALFLPRAERDRPKSIRIA
jgi:HSP20 family protein